MLPEVAYFLNRKSRRGEGSGEKLVEDIPPARLGVELRQDRVEAPLQTVQEQPL